MAAKSFKKPVQTLSSSPPPPQPAKAAPKNNSYQSQPQASAVNMHLIKMVERATTDYYYDVQYIHDLLLSFRCFTTPANLFELLVQRCG
jgi:hypothetical protein